MPPGSPKKSPDDPNGESTSGNALQNRPKKVLRGEAKHSNPAPTVLRSVVNTSGPTEAWNPYPWKEGHGEQALEH
jgi:hypothetical protein